MNILITGGACAGKTSCIEKSKEFIKNKGFDIEVYEEVPTRMILNGETPEKLGKGEFLNKVIKKQIEQIMDIKPNEKCVRIYDGSPIDMIKFINRDELENIFKEYSTSLDEIINFYDCIIHLESVSKEMPELYSNENNKARTLDVKKSAERDEKLLEVYSNHKNRYIVPVCESFEEKIIKFKDIISEILGL